MSSSSKIASSLDKLSAKAKQIRLDPYADKWIIFSDHHRGVGDKADDFAPCKQTYLNALAHYLEQGYGLLILGDAEEFWENTLKNVISKYKDVLALEREFHVKTEFIKIWGNHDDAWSYLTNLKRYLHPLFGQLESFEAVQFIVESDQLSYGKILMAHGHQGSRASDKYAGISKWFVRYFWRSFQRIFHVALSTPSKSKELKDKHDLAMYEWARSKAKQMIICGHTHQPVFMSQNHVDVLSKELASLKPDSDAHIKRIEEIKAKLESLLARTSAIGTLVNDPYPCYFNSGCCSFSDGDITGLELHNGKIELVKWDSEKRTSIASEELLKVFGEL